jgi:hypothetical protein
MTQVGTASTAPDFFISYTQADRPWAEWIAWALEEYGYQVLIQAWDMVPGSNWIAGVDRGVRDAARTITVLSDDYLSSVYATAEWRAAWAGDPIGEHRKLLPIRVQDCDRPGLLAGVVGIDLFDLTEGEARERLRAAIDAVMAGRAVPSTAPPFPQAERVVPTEPRFPGTLPDVWNVPTRNPHFTDDCPDPARYGRSREDNGRRRVRPPIRWRLRPGLVDYGGAACPDHRSAR